VQRSWISAFLSGEDVKLKVWGGAIRIIPWLQAAYLPTAVQFCRIRVQSIANPKPSVVLTARTSRLGIALGLSPPARKRLGASTAGGPTVGPLPPPSRATKFFDVGWRGPSRDSPGETLWFVNLQGSL